MSNILDPCTKLIGGGGPGGSKNRSLGIYPYPKVINKYVLVIMLEICI